MMQRRPRRENKKHLKWISERCCIVCASNDSVQACHIKYADARVSKPQSSNIGMKADDRFTLPMCAAHHANSHNTPEREWWSHLHMDPILLALALYSISGDDEEGDRIIQNAMLGSMALRSA